MCDLTKVWNLKHADDTTTPVYFDLDGYDINVYNSTDKTGEHLLMNLRCVNSSSDIVGCRTSEAMMTDMTIATGNSLHRDKGYINGEAQFNKFTCNKNGEKASVNEIYMNDNLMAVQYKMGSNTGTAGAGAGASAGAGAGAGAGSSSDYGSIIGTGGPIYGSATGNVELHTHTHIHTTAF